MSRDIIELLNSGEIPTDFNWQTGVHPLVPLVTQLPAEPTVDQVQNAQLVSEDLRDGLHGIKHYPAVADMLDYVGALYRLGITTMTVGIFPGNGNKIDKSIRQLLAEMRDQYPEVTPVVLSLATEASLNWLIECKQINPRLTAIIFMGSAPSRILVEEWTQDYILQKLAWAIDTATQHGIDVIGATEHTTQTPPDFLRKIIMTEVEHGAKYFCVADTIGIARPMGAYRIIKFVKQVLNEMNANHVLVDWHGHDDQGNGVSNAMAAISAGADRVHTVARGMGERAGNTMMEAVLLNFNSILKDHEASVPWDLRELHHILTLYDRLTASAAPDHGTLGARSHETSLGIHTAAILKARDLADEAQSLGYNDLAEKLKLMSHQIYTANAPEEVGKEYSITVSPWSGVSTVKLAFQLMGGNLEKLNQETIENVLKTAKDLSRQLTDTELRGLFEF